MPHTLTGLPRFQINSIPTDALGRITFIYGNPVKQDIVVSSTVRINLPKNLQIDAPSTHEHCPAFEIGEMVSAIGPDLNGEYILVEGARTVELKSDNCITHRTFTESSTGPAGPTGQKGDGGTGISGLKGEDGELGEKGAKGTDGDSGAPGAPGGPGGPGPDGPPGPPGPPGGSSPAGPPGPPGDPADDGEKGAKGEDGTIGSKGDPGEGLDWNDTQQSILIAGTKFGPRLIGVCQNGTYRYVYVFASDPTS